MTNSRHATQLTKLIQKLSYRHSAWDVFADFLEASAIAISNAVDTPQAKAREQRYLEIVKRYSKEEFADFPNMLGELTLALEERHHDVLGVVFHELELHNKYKGQFFTPYPVCQMMAKMTVADRVNAEIEAKGHVTVSEPACGSGAMLIAMAEALKDAGTNYQQSMHATATDLDLKCVHMAYLQLSLLHIPAVIIHGNTLSMEEYSHWLTPAHIMGGWRWKLKKAPAPAPGPTPELQPEATVPDSATAEQLTLAL